MVANRQGREGRRRTRGICEDTTGGPAPSTGINNAEFSAPLGGSCWEHADAKRMKERSRIG